MATVVEFECPQLVNHLQDLSIQPQNKMKSTAEETHRVGCENNHHGDCAVCLNKIVLQETALVKGCEHAYCVTCILRWATYKEEPTCPQCKHPFEFLYIHRSLDGSLQDYMFEESVCLLLRASWFKPLIVEEKAEIDDDMDDLYMYDDAEVDFAEDYFIGSSPRLRIGNRRWGDNGYVSAGRQEARPVVYRPNLQELGAGPSCEPKKETPKELVGRRAKRALKREAADKAAAEKHQQCLARMGSK
ncbi:hypothetical protein K7X08_025470 [Anisodus acutangulus]|uniref:RING-type domain-containing protein n=1 Tax=Anisodus acutangulus TaxID=402998 RepID=A0A9Q1LSP5_9SOLA|nr:hypothetical protein K7X08_025470 [Anisodus acutangulus]